MSKDKPVGDVAKSLIFFGLNIAEGQLTKKLNDPELKKGVETVIPLLREVVSELNDDDPNNKEQIKATLAAWTNGPLADYLETILDELVSKIKKEEEREVVLFVGEAFINMLRIVTDLNPANVEQIRGYYLSKEFLTESKNIVIDNIIWPALDKKNVSPEVRNVINVIIIEILDLLLKSNKE